MCCCVANVASLCRVSGVCDHYATSDEHALEIARDIVANLNWKESSSEVRVVAPFIENVMAVGLYHVYFCFFLQLNIPTEYEEPLYSQEDFGGIVPVDTKKPFDIRKVQYMNKCCC